MRKILVFVFVVLAVNAWGGADTWDGGHPSADAACRARMDESGAFRFHRAQVNGNVAYCYSKAKDGKGPEYHDTSVTKDEAPPPPPNPKDADEGDAKADGNAQGKATGVKAADDDCAKLAAMDEAKLKKEVIKRFKTVVAKVNDEFAQTPSIAMEVVSEAEIRGASYTFGLVQTQNGAAISDKTLNVIYGHILERLVAERIEKYDQCLLSYLVYVPNPVQMQTIGGSPDFNGTGKAQGLELDITTAGEVPKKKAKGKNYEFVLYDRKLKMGAEGVVVKN